MINVPPYRETFICIHIEEVGRIFANRMCNEDSKCGRIKAETAPVEAAAATLRLLLFLTPLAFGCSRAAEPPERPEEPDGASGMPAGDRFDDYVRRGSPGVTSAASEGAVSMVLVHPPLRECRPTGEPSGPLRVVTWNIKAGQMAPIEQVADQMAKWDADILALQEVDMLVDRTGRVDQPRFMAEKLGYDFIFGASIKHMNGDYGLAVLSRLPVVDVQRRYHSAEVEAKGYTTTALEITLCAFGEPVVILDQHSDFTDPQPDVLESLAWFPLDPEANQIWLGDFNQTPGDEGPMRARAAGWIDALGDDPSPTFASIRLDHLLMSAALYERFKEAKVFPTTLSDHNAIIADFGP